MSDLTEAAVDGLCSLNNLTAVNMCQSLHAKTDTQDRHILRLLQKNATYSCAKAIVISLCDVKSVHSVSMCEASLSKQRSAYLGPRDGGESQVPEI